VKIDASVNLAPAPVVVRFVALGPVAAHWTWNFDDGTVLSKQPNKVSHPYASAGDYNVTATYRDPATGAEMTGTVTVMLYPSTPARVQISGRPGIQVLPKDGNAKVTYTVTYPTRDTGPWQRDLEIYNQNHVLVTEKVWSTNTATDVTTDVEFSKIGYYWATVRVRKAAPAIGPWLSSGVALNIVDPDLMQPSPRPTSPSPSTPKTPRP
jgi:PKD repeat protein